MDHSPANETAVLSAPHGSLRDRYDVIIIGSGYGGGVSAARLARAGKRVCVIERGREYPTGTFPARFPELRQSFQVTSKRVKTGSDSALYDIRLGDDMHVLVGRGLGG
ncbi:MAG: FAD-binding protein, partial [Pseudomonadota bacterium]